MAAVVGALRAILSLESAAFTDGLKRAQTGLQRFSAQAQAIGSRMQKIGAIMSVAGVAMAAGIRRGINAADDMGDMAEKFGIPVEALSKLAYAAEVSGTPVEALATGLRKLSEKMADAGAGSKGAVALFDRLGVSVTDASGKMRATEDVLTDVSAVIAAMPDGAEKTALALDIFGKSGTDLIPLLNKGRDAIAGMVAEAEDLGLVISKDTADAAGDFNDNLTRISRAANGLFIQLAAELAPIFREISERIISAAKAFAKLSPEIRRFAAIGVTVLAVGGPIVVGLGLAVSAVGALAGAFAAMGAALLANPILAVIGAVAVGAILIWQNWDWLKEKMIAAWAAIKEAIGLDELIARWKPVIEWLAAAFQAHADLVIPIWKAIGSAARDAADYMRREWGGLIDWIGARWVQLDSVLGPVRDHIGTAMSIMWTGVRDMASAAASFIGARWQDVSAALGPVLSRAGADMAVAWEAVKTSAAVAVEAVTGVWVGIREYFGLVLVNIKGAFVDGWEAIKAFVSTWPQAFVEFGYEIVEGLKRGILERWDSMIAGLQLKWQELKDGFADLMGIQSPSRVFRDFGQYITQGLALGVRDGAAEPIAAITDLGTDMVDTTKEAADQLRDAGKGLFRDWVTGAKSAGEALAGLAQRLADMLANSAFDAIFGKGGIGGGIWDGIAKWLGFADGGVFAGGRLTAFADGGIVTSPTMFGMPDGLGLMGEAGPEAIMPLTRGPGGRLGVQAMGGGQTVRIVVEEGNMFASRVEAISDGRAIEVVRQYDAEIAPVSRGRAAREVG